MHEEQYSYPEDLRHTYTSRPPSSRTPPPARLSPTAHQWPSSALLGPAPRELTASACAFSLSARNLAGLVEKQTFLGQWKNIPDDQVPRAACRIPPRAACRRRSLHSRDAVLLAELNGHLRAFDRVNCRVLFADACHPPQEVMEKHQGLGQICANLEDLARYLEENNGPRSPGAVRRHSRSQ